MTHRGRLLRYGAKLAARGILARIGLVVCALTALFFAGRAFFLAHRHVASLYYVPSIAEASLVWGGGILVAFGAALSAFKSDRTDGTFDLVIGRTGSARAYVLARAGGLVLLLAIVNVAAGLLVGIATMLAAPSGQAAIDALWVTAVSLLFGVASAIVLGLVAFAALGSSGRAGGYGRLFLVLVVPEIARRFVLRNMDADYMDVMSISAALAGLRESLLPHMLDAGKLIRCAFVVTVVAGVAYAIVRRQAESVKMPGRDGGAP